MINQVFRVGVELDLLRRSYGLSLINESADEPSQGWVLADSPMC